MKKHYTINSAVLTVYCRNEIKTEANNSSITNCQLDQILEIIIIPNTELNTLNHIIDIFYVNPRN